MIFYSYIKFDIEIFIICNGFILGLHETIILFDIVWLKLIPKNKACKKFDDVEVNKFNIFILKYNV